MEPPVQTNVVLLQTRRPLEERPEDCPAQFYKFTGNPEIALKSERFMAKAAAFQEIRDCLIAVDHNELSPHEAERLISYLVQRYLAPISLDGIPAARGELS